MLGYPGTISSQTYALKPGATPEEVSELKKTLSLNELTWTEGEIIESGELLAISNTSTPGMAGAPLLIKVPGRWEVCGLLAGGPAAFGHCYLLKLASACRNQAKFEEVLNMFKESSETEVPGLYPFPGLFSEIESFYATRSREQFVGFLELQYKYEIRSYFKYVKKIKGAEAAKLQMNHNLVVPLQQYLDRINS